MLSSKIPLVLLSLAGFKGTFAQDYVLEGIAQSPWETWGGVMEICPQGSYVFGMRLKVHTDQGIFGDDTVLNGVDFLCIGMTQRNSSATGTTQITTVKSKVGHKRDHGLLLECPEPSFAVGFELRSEKPDAIGPLGDDTVANNLRVLCDDSPDIPTRLEGSGMNWGDWMPALKCPRSMRICGIQTRVEDPNGDEDTTMNNLNVGCCA